MGLRVPDGILDHASYPLENLGRCLSSLRLFLIYKAMKTWDWRISKGPGSPELSDIVHFY